MWHYSWIAIAIAVVVVWIVVGIRGGKRNEGKCAPSPAGLPVIGNLHQLGGLPHRALQKLSEKHGPLMLLRLGHTPTLVVSSAEAVREIFKSHDVAFSDRPRSTASEALFYEGKSIAFGPYSEQWRQGRRICILQLLSQKRVQSFRCVREDEVSSLVSRLRDAGVKGEAVNLSRLLLSTINNITTRCIIGHRYSGSTFIGEAGKKITVLLVAFSVGDFFPSLRWLDRLRGFTGSLASTAKLLDGFYSRVVDEHRRGLASSDVKDFVDILLQLHSDGDLDLTPDRIKAILQDMLLAGVETSSTTMEWIMAELLNHPEEMAKVQEEVRRVVGQGHKKEVELEDVERMEYLKCFVKETMRLHPPFPLLLPRQTLKSCRVGGYDVPAGTRVLVNCLAIHTDPTSWDNPNLFSPQRFLNNPIDLNSRHCFHFIPFGFGRRECPGMTFATAGLHYLLANLLYFFDWPSSSADHVDMAEINGITVSKKLPIVLVPTPYSP